MPSEQLPSDHYDGLCSRCSQIVTYSAPDILKDKYGLDISDHQIALGSDCRLCSMLQRNLNCQSTLGDPVIMPPIVRTDGPMSYDVLTENCISTMFDARYVHFQCVDAYASKFGDLIVSAEEGNAAARLHKRRPPLRDFASEAAYAQIRSWIENCTKKHVSCRSIMLANRLPLRVIDVGNFETEPRLFQPARGTTGQYVALSYCWGSSKQIVLTKSLMDSGHHEFPMSRLPPTLRDAINICRKLNFQYIWIDSLCIIQDSRDSEDWIQQSGVMDEIYGNASLTIAVAAATGISDGIFNPAEEPKSGFCTIPLNVSEWSDTQYTSRRLPGELTLRFYPGDIDEKQPLSSRAWAFQEHLLSNRVLSYQREQLVWECESTKLYMIGPLHAKKPPKAERRWEDVVMQYTERMLTFDDDRLMALSGYVKSIASIGGRYFAGLWQSHLVEHMLWFTKERPPRVRPASYRAPSWSWGSINGPIEYVAAEAIGKQDSIMELVQVSVAISELNPFGTIKASPPSYLHLRSFIKPVVGLQVPSAKEPLPNQKAFRRGVGRSWWIQFDITDIEERIKQPPPSSAYSLPHSTEGPLYCLRLTEHIALIVIQVWKEGMEEIGNIFERAGLVRHWHREPWDWWDEVKNRTELYLV